MLTDHYIQKTLHNRLYTVILAVVIIHHTAMQKFIYGLYMLTLQTQTVCDLFANGEKTKPVQLEIVLVHINSLN